jgi:hypothetical protein
LELKPDPLSSQAGVCVALPCFSLFFAASRVPNKGQPHATNVFSTFAKTSIEEQDAPGGRTVPSIHFGLKHFETFCFRALLRRGTRARKRPDNGGGS